MSSAPSKPASGPRNVFSLEWKVRIVIGATIFFVLSALCLVWDRSVENAVEFSRQTALVQDGDFAKTMVDYLNHARATMIATFIIASFLLLLANYLAVRIIIRRLSATRST